MRKLLSWGLAIAAVVALFGGYIWYQNTPGRLDQFAQCLKDKGVKFYGAYWCPHCQNQKAMFGRSAKKLEQNGVYIECSTPDGRGQLQICKDAKVTGYPTWEFKDKSRMGGEVALEDLAEKSGCQLPK